MALSFLRASRASGGDSQERDPAHRASDPNVAQFVLVRTARLVAIL
jgi:hypothetical protein